MPKPEMRAPIQPSALVCDRTTAYLQVHVPPALPPNFLRSLSLAFGFEREADGYWLRSLTFGAVGIPAQIKATIVNRETVGFRIDLSPLVALHETSSASCDERGLAGRHNWLKATDIRQDNTWAVTPLALALPEARDRCLAMINHLLGNHVSGDGALSARARIASWTFTLRRVEIAYDFAGVSPNLVVNRFEHIVARLCPQVANRRYPRSSYRTGADEMGRFVEGHIHQDERIKVYVKALPERVRFELELSGSRLRQYAHPTRTRLRSLALTDARSFMNIFMSVARHVASRFRYLMMARLRIVSRERTAVQLYAELVRRLDDLETVNMVLDQLAGERRIRASVGRSILRRLTSRSGGPPILAAPQRHGIYPPSSAWRRAVDLIAVTPGFFSRSSSE